jgi:hypothetical protein
MAKLSDLPSLRLAFLISYIYWLNFITIRYTHINRPAIHVYNGLQKKKNHIYLYNAQWINKNLLTRIGLTQHGTFPMRVWSSASRSGGSCTIGVGGRLKRMGIWVAGRSTDGRQSRRPARSSIPRSGYSRSSRFFQGAMLLW